ncbi:MAG: hypothetical protein AABZ57_07530 [Candidatus Margulisiibacteriota bacterium]
MPEERLEDDYIVVAQNYADTIAAALLPGVRLSELRLGKRPGVDRTIVTKLEGFKTMGLFNEDALDSWQLRLWLSVNGLPLSQGFFTTFGSCDYALGKREAITAVMAELLSCLPGVEIKDISDTVAKDGTFKENPSPHNNSGFNAVISLRKIEQG